ncbi:MAG: TolB family protein [Planctomycetota bacterium]
MKQLLKPILLAVSAIFITSSATAQDYTAISKSTTGLVADDHCGEARMSGDGRYVAFTSKASNLTVAGSTNGFYDIYLRDTVLETTERISLAIGGVEPNGDSRWPEITESGSHILFSSTATNLVGGDTNGSGDLFLYTVATGATERVNLTYLGLEAGAGVQMDTRRYDLSDDGRFIVFTSTSDDYVTIMTSNATRNVFLRDRLSGTTTLVSYVLGDSGSAGGYAPTIDGDGSHIAFTSGYYLMVPEDTDSNDDVFLYTVSTGVVSLISVAVGGSSGSSPGHSKNPRFSPDGRFVVFESTSADLAMEDTNPYSDIFLRDLTLSTTEMISLNSAGAVGPYETAQNADLSADGRYIVFSGTSKSQAPTPILSQNSYLRDRTAATTTLINAPRWWFAIVMRGGTAPQITDAGDAVIMLDPSAGTSEEGSSIYAQVNHRKIEAGVGTMSCLSGGSGLVGGTMYVTGYDGPASAPFYIVYSPNMSGLSYAGHSFDVGAPATILGSGTTDADGNLTWTSPIIPASASGKVIYIEIAATDAGIWYDSNPVRFEVL